MIEELFSTPLYVSVLNEFESIKIEMSEVLPNVDFMPGRKLLAGTHLLSDPSFKEDLFEKYDLPKLKEELDVHIREYCKHIQYEPKEYDLTSWLALYQKGQYAQIHDHGDADISGVIYFQTNGNDGNIFFTSPNPHLRTAKIFQHLPSMTWTHQPAVGKVILFPGWLQHGVMTNETDGIRVSFSFNVKFK